MPANHFSSSSSSSSSSTYSSLGQLHLLRPDGNVQQIKLGDPIQDPDAAVQVVVGAGVWVAAELEDKLAYCLVSQVQAPGQYIYRSDQQYKLDVH